MNVNKIQNIVDENGIIFLSYGGFLTQTLIAGMTEALEKETEYHNLNMGISNKIFTIFIELSQNIMNYSKNIDEKNKDIASKGLIVVGKDEEGNYYIHSQNIIGDEDREKIEPRLKEIDSLNHDEIKKRYRELRRSGKDQHGKGAGIGFYEVAKISDEMKYEFKEININKYYFHFISRVNINKDK